MRIPLAIYAFAMTFAVLPEVFGLSGSTSPLVWLGLTAAMAWGSRAAWGILVCVQAISLCYVAVLIPVWTIGLGAAAVLGVLSMALLFHPSVQRHIEERRAERDASRARRPAV